MAKTKPESKTRGHEHEFEIDASPDEVWKAITEAAELMRWFPFDAEVQPGEGGQIIYGWGDELRGSCRIQVWQPSKHLKTSWLAEAADPGDEQSAQVAVDWFLEGKGGRTRLRLVHSGFGTGAEWDEEFDGTKRGWDYELRSLKHYLERHRGKSRTAFAARRAVELDAEAVWKRMTGTQGMLRGTGCTPLRVGEPVKIYLATGDRVEGEVLQYLPPTDFAFSAGNLNHGLLRIAFEKCFGRPEAQVWVSLWDYPEHQAASLKSRLEEALARIFA